MGPSGDTSVLVVMIDDCFSWYLNASSVLHLSIPILDILVVILLEIDLSRTRDYLSLAR